MVVQSKKIVAEKAETESPAQQQLELAYDRTIYATERTLMAWIRTSLTMITFGFAIERFSFNRDVHMVEQGELLLRESGLVGLSLVILGVVVMNIAMFQHMKILKQLELRTDKHLTGWSLGLFTTVMLQLIGILMSVFIVSKMI